MKELKKANELKGHNNDLGQLFLDDQCSHSFYIYHRNIYLIQAKANLEGLDNKGCEARFRVDKVWRSHWCKGTCSECQAAKEVYEGMLR